METHQTDSHHQTVIIRQSSAFQIKRLFSLAPNSSLLRKFGFLQHLSEIHTSHQYLEDLHWFEAIFKISGQAIFEDIEVKGHFMLNFEVTTSKFWKFGCQPLKSVCIKNGCKVLIYLTLIFFLFALSLWGTIKKTNKSELWNYLSYRGLFYFFEVGSQTFRNDYKFSRS